MGDRKRRRIPKVHCAVSQCHSRSNLPHLHLVFCLPHTLSYTQDKQKCLFVLFYIICCIFFFYHWKRDQT
jgi:hypothetical protein